MVQVLNCEKRKWIWRRKGRGGGFIHASGDSLFQSMVSVNFVSNHGLLYYLATRLLIGNTLLPRYCFLSYQNGKALTWWVGDTPICTFRGI
jgi:hypothetical protein